MRFKRYLRPGSVLLLFIGFAVAGGVAFTQSAQPDRDFPFVSASEIDAALVQAAANPTAVARLYPDGVYQYFVATRKNAGLAEIHTQWSDVTTIRSGRGALRTGRTLASRREISPGEWRGDAVEDSVERQLGAGDLVVIPVGMAHQFRPIGNDPLVYVTVKVPAVSPGTAPLR